MPWFFYLKDFCSFLSSTGEVQVLYCTHLYFACSCLPNSPLLFTLTCVSLQSHWTSHLVLSAHLCFFDFVSAIHFYWYIANSFSFLRLSSNVIANTQISWPLWQPNVILLIFMETVTLLKKNYEYSVYLFSRWMLSNETFWMMAMFVLCCPRR